MNYLGISEHPKCESTPQYKPSVATELNELSLAVERVSQVWGKMSDVLRPLIPALPADGCPKCGTQTSPPVCETISSIRNIKDLANIVERGILEALDSMQL